MATKIYIFLFIWIGSYFLYSKSVGLKWGLFTVNPLDSPDSFNSQEPIFKVLPLDEEPKAELKNEELKSLSLEEVKDIKSRHQELIDAVVLIGIVNESCESPELVCSGVFIAPHVIMTAGHCVTHRAGYSLRYFRDGLLKNGIKADKILYREEAYLYNPDHRRERGDIGSAIYDIGFLVFNKPQFSKPAKPIDRVYQEDEPVLIVGYGKNHQRTGVYEKRFGINEIPIWPYGMSPLDGAILIAGFLEKDRGQSKTNKYLTDIGDSGGALFVGGKLAGIAVGGDTLINLGFSPSDFIGESGSIFVDVFHDEVQAAIKKVLNPSSIQK